MQATSEWKWSCLHLSFSPFVRKRKGIYVPVTRTLLLVYQQSVIRIQQASPSRGGGVVEYVCSPFACFTAAGWNPQASRIKPARYCVDLVYLCGLRTSHDDDQLILRWFLYTSTPTRPAKKARECQWKKFCLGIEDEPEEERPNAHSLTVAISYRQTEPHLTSRRQ